MYEPRIRHIIQSAGRQTNKLAFCKMPQRGSFLREFKGKGAEELEHARENSLKSPNYPEITMKTEGGEKVGGKNLTIFFPASIFRINFQAVFKINI